MRVLRCEIFSEDVSKDVSNGLGIRAIQAEIVSENGVSGVIQHSEYERSARGEYRVRSKLRGYGSPERQDRWPVLLICWNDSVEGVFQQVGQEMELRMATATMSRFKANGAFGVEGTWEVYGKPGGALR